MTSAENRRAVFLRFSEACGRCGRCVEVCPLHETTDKAESEAPVTKLRRYFIMLAKKSLPASEIKSIAEETTACTLCGLCVGVCPFSFNFIEMYKDLLAYAEKVHPELVPEQNCVPPAV